MDEGKMNFLKSVLDYSTAHSDGTTNNSEIAKEMTPDKKKFLEEVLNTKAITPVEEMKKCMKCLNNPEETLERHLEALETLRDWCEDINFSIDFHKLDGYPMIPTLLKNENDEFRALACDLIGTLVQNNEYCQKTLIKTDTLNLLFDRLENDVIEVKIKALYAISCFVREFFEGEQKLLEICGVEKLVKAINIENEKLQRKCCFLIASICKNVAIKHEFTKYFIIEKLVNMYQHTQFNIKEHVLLAIISLIDNNPDAINQAKHMNLDFKNIITQRLVVIGDDPMHKEEKDNATFLMEALFKN